MTAKDLEQEVAKLPPGELSEFRHWFETFDTQQWDDQIRCDAENGKLNSLADQALDDFDDGRCSKL
jgi:hypothetical protein